jgi:hypothetical protein
MTVRMAGLLLCSAVLCACSRAGTGIAARCRGPVLRSHDGPDQIAQAVSAQPLRAAGTPWHSRLQMKHRVVRKLCPRFISLSSPSPFWWALRVRFDQEASQSSSHAFLYSSAVC